MSDWLERSYMARLGVARAGKAAGTSSTASGRATSTMSTAPMPSRS
ncbi:MAG: hypothetical protein R3D25_10760 [Geminicoccaceae bacterium]